MIGNISALYFVYKQAQHKFVLQNMYTLKVDLLDYVEMAPTWKQYLIMSQKMPWRNVLCFNQPSSRKHSFAKSKRKSPMILSSVFLCALGIVFVIVRIEDNGESPTAPNILITYVTICAGLAAKSKRFIPQYIHRHYNMSRSLLSNSFGS